jgi:hypothetical protein
VFLKRHSMRLVKCTFHVSPLIMIHVVFISLSDFAISLL